jgi:hypothetical protein
MYITLRYLYWALLLSFSLFFIGCAEGYTTCEIYCPCYDGKTSASNIARWDGSQWLPLGSGVNGTVERIIADSASSELYVFGEFTNAGGIPVNGQAKWSEATQSWSAMDVQMPINNGNFHNKYNPTIFVAGKIYTSNIGLNKLYNPDGSYFNGRGLYKWDGNQWKKLLVIKVNRQGEIEDTPPVIVGKIGNTLYLTYINYLMLNKLYLFDLISNQIIDSLHESSPPFYFITDEENGYDEGNGYITVSSMGVFIAKNDAIYQYYKGNIKKVCQVSSDPSYYYNQLSASNEYLSFISGISQGYVFGDTRKCPLNILIYDFKGDSIFTVPIKYTNLTVSKLRAKVSGHTLFVGGTFYLKDGSADVRNIGAYDLREKKWYDLAGGVCGPVNAMAEMNGSMYVGGEFSTVGKK